MASSKAARVQTVHALSGEHIRRLARQTAVAATAAILGAFSAHLVLRSRTHIKTEDAFIEARISTIGARVGGSVKEVLVADNQLVREGERLIQLDPRDSTVSLGRARAAVMTAMGRYEAAVIGVALVDESTHNQIQLVRSDLRGAADGALRLASKERLRMRSLLRDHVVSREAVDQVDAAYKEARAKVDGIRATLRQTKGRRREVDARRAEMKSAAGQLSEAQAELQEAEQQVEYTTITAPFSGWITKKNVEVGQIVGVAQPLLAVVSNIEIWIVANFKENQLTRVQPGQSALVSVDMYPDLVLHARVDSIQAGTGSRFSLLPADNASGNFIKVVQRLPVKLLIDPADIAQRVLFPGISVVPTIDIGIERRADAPSPPASSRQQNERYDVDG